MSVVAVVGINSTPRPKRRAPTNQYCWCSKPISGNLGISTTFAPQPLPLHVFTKDAACAPVDIPEGKRLLSAR